MSDPHRWSVLLAVTLASYLVVRRCGRLARQRGLSKPFSTSGGEPNAHATFLPGLLQPNTSTDILDEALEITPVALIPRAA